MNKITLVNYEYTLFIYIGKSIVLPSNLKVHIFKPFGKFGRFDCNFGRFNCKLGELKDWKDTDIYSGDFWVCVCRLSTDKPILASEIKYKYHYVFNKNGIAELSGTLRHLELGEKYQIEGNLKNILDQIGLSRKMISKECKWAEYE